MRRAGEGRGGGPGWGTFSTGQGMLASHRGAGPSAWSRAVGCQGSPHARFGPHALTPTSHQVHLTPTSRTPSLPVFLHQQRPSAPRPGGGPRFGELGPRANGRLQDEANVYGGQHSRNQRRKASRAPGPPRQTERAARTGKVPWWGRDCRFSWTSRWGGLERSRQQRLA